MSAQSEHSDNKIHPRDTSIVLFPGQGYQYVGMAKDLIKHPKAKHVFDVASKILNYDLLQVCLEGPQEKLDQTKYCQPAVVVASLAALELLKEQQPKLVANCVGTSGFSLGEITALTFAGALKLEDALKLVRLRAEAMQVACDAHKGAMLKVVLTPESNIPDICDKAKQWAKKKGVEDPECAIGNYLYPNCIVLAGNIEAIDFVEKNADEFKLIYPKRVPVTGGFHCALMQPAFEPLKKAMSELKISDPVINVYSNIDGEKYENAEHIRKMLPIQMMKSVKWDQFLQGLYNKYPKGQYPQTFTCGPGRSLKMFLKGVNEEASNSCTIIEA